MMRKKIIHIGIFLVIVGLLFFKWQQSRNHGPVEIDSGRFITMGSFARIRLYAKDYAVGYEALDRAKAALKKFDEHFSTYRDDSELSAVNRNAAEKPVPISADTRYLLEKSLEYSRLSDGAFDITVSPLITLWKKVGKENRLPTAEEIQKAKETIGWQKVILSDKNNATTNTVRFVVPGVKLAIDAIGQGYSSDVALDALKIPGVEAAIVDVGGEIACFGRAWIIGIQDPFAVNNDDPLSESPRWKIRLSNGGVSTSGNYRHYKTIAGKIYSHIIDPRTGMPAEKLPSVTVIAPKAIDADALATAISVLGPEKGLELARSLPGVEVFLVGGTAKSPKLYRSEGFEKYEIK
jgi:thiamine biosynthesis lipoprotein